MATVGIAFYGINRWNRELIGKTKFEAARLILKATYKLRDAISNARNPFISAGEFPTEYGGAMTHPSHQEEASAYSHVYKNRWKPIWEALQEYDTASLEAEAIWGATIKNKTDVFRSCVNTLQASIASYIGNIHSGRTDTDTDFVAKITKNIQAQADSNDDLSNQIKSSICAIEEEMKQHLRR